MDFKEALRVFASKLLSFATSLKLIFGIFVVIYLILLAIYRLYITPSAKFPGPKLAALTFWYEFYYDVWHEGQYTWKIRELHDQYGLYFPKRFARYQTDLNYQKDLSYASILLKCIVTIRNSSMSYTSVLRKDELISGYGQ